MIGSGKPSAVYANRMQRYRDEAWLIWSNKWNCWYRANCQGYTSDIAQAGIYDREVAARHQDRQWPRKYRDTEAFPISVVRAMILRRIEQLRAEASEREAQFAVLLSHIDRIAA